MSYIKKNVNLLLVLIVLIIIAAMIGFTTYYQTTYRNLTSEYNDKVALLDQAQQNITQQRENILKAQTELDLRAQDKTKFESLYNEILDQKTKLDKDLLLTKSTLASTQSQLTESLTELQKARSDLATALTDVQTLTSRNSALNAENDQLCGSLKAANSSANC